VTGKSAGVGNCEYRCGQAPLGYCALARLSSASNRDVHDVSKNTTLPIARDIVET
jgi:hypothetical protein